MNRYLVDYITKDGDLDHYWCYAPSARSAEESCTRENHNVKEIIQVIKAS